jgi:archaeosine synthase
VNETPEFLIARGHDGPARAGNYVMGEIAISTPTLIGPAHSEALTLRYRTYGRSEPVKDSPMIVSIPGVKDIEMDELHEYESVLLPSMIAGEVLDSEAGKLLMHQQEYFLENQHIPPSCAIVRVPTSLDLEFYLQSLQQLGNLGVRAAAFRFTGNLGPNALKMLILRSQLPRNWLTLAIGRIEPCLVPLMHYLGFDVIDTSRAFEAAAQGIRLWRMDSEQVGDADRARHCACVACAHHSDITSLDISSLFETLTKHNLSIFQMMLSESIHAMRSGQLRWLVESFTHASPSVASILRRVDAELYPFLEEFTPTVGKSPMPLIGPESYDAPAIKRFREKVACRFKPPARKRLVLLLPCSARKPYSDSKSHKRFARIIEAAIGPARSGIAETILTSPLGVIPRELERIHPVAHYDIPVTGDWDAEETEIAVHALIAHMEKFDESTVVVAHVSGGYLGIVKNAEERLKQTLIYTSSDAKATSGASLDLLDETLRDMRELILDDEYRRTDLEDTLRATADFQFGLGTGELLIPEGAALRGKLYRTVICQIDKEQVCAYNASSGMLSLTLAGARRIVDSRQGWVRFEGKEVKGGSIFAVGVREADSDIRPGDEVIVIDKSDNVVAVGRSEMSGKEMCEFEKGRAVTIRHKLGVTER